MASSYLIKGQKIEARATPITMATKMIDANALRAVTMSAGILAPRAHPGMLAARACAKTLAG
jgi:hypothetical protein